MTPVAMVASGEERDLAAELCSRFGLDPVIAGLLVRRGIRDLKQAEAYINPSLAMLHSPFLIPKMHEAVARLERAVNSGERIGIFADSDLDGLSALAVLERLLGASGDIPDRVIRYPVDDDDYGLSMRVVGEFGASGVRLLVTLDSGIRDIDEIRRARELGMDVLVCDHHEPGDELPDAIVVNPKTRNNPYPFRDLAGVGVAFKLCSAVLFSRGPLYKRRHAIITRDGSGVHILRITDMLAESPVSFQARASVDKLELADVDSVLHYDLDDDLRKDIQARFGHNADDFLNFLEPLENNASAQTLTLSEWCAKFSVREDMYTRRIDLLERLFFEACYAKGCAILDFADSTLDLVALGTIADIMPLIDENRALVRYGIDALGRTRHAGLRLLIDSNGGVCTARDVAWRIAPFLNTPGRYGRSELLASFFLESDKEALGKIIREISDMNGRRKDELSLLYARLYEECARDDRHRAGGGMFFVCDPEVPDGLCGLLANRLADAFKMPVIVVALTDGRDVVKGSGRASGSFDFFSCVVPFMPLFERAGGHPQAFGFSVRRERIDEVRKKIGAAVESAPRGGLTANGPAYAELAIERLGRLETEFVESLKLFEPVGHRNEEPLFISRGVRPSAFRTMGAGQAHGKFTIDGPAGVEAIGWGMAAEMAAAARGAEVDLIYSLSLNEFRGVTRPRMLIKAITQRGAVDND